MKFVVLSKPSVFIYAAQLKSAKFAKIGGLKWTRTTDLTLIRRAL